MASIPVSPTSPNTEPTALSLRTLANHALLSADEELALIVQAQAGDRAARDRLVLANMRLVVDIASRYHGLHSMTLDDLTQEGIIGLMHAIGKFDVQTHHRLSTYATDWIRQHIQRGVHKQDAMVRLPTYLHESKKALPPEVCSLDAPLKAPARTSARGSANTARTLADVLIQEEQQTDQEKHALTPETRKLLAQLLTDHLTARQAHIMALRYRLDTSIAPTKREQLTNPVSFARIATHLNMRSPSLVQRECALALATLKSATDMSYALAFPIQLPILGVA